MNHLMQDSEIRRPIAIALCMQVALDQLWCVVKQLLVISGRHSLSCPSRISCLLRYLGAFAHLSQKGTIKQRL